MASSVAVLGVGSMGLPLAHRLVTAGFRVLAYDADVKALERLRMLYSGYRPLVKLQIVRGPSLAVSRVCRRIGRRCLGAKVWCMAAP